MSLFSSSLLKPNLGLCGRSFRLDFQRVLASIPSDNMPFGRTLIFRQLFEDKTAYLNRPSITFESTIQSLSNFRFAFRIYFTHDKIPFLCRNF